MLLTRPDLIPIIVFNHAKTVQYVLAVHGWLLIEHLRVEKRFLVDLFTRV